MPEPMTKEMIEYGKREYERGLNVAIQICRERSAAHGRRSVEPEFRFLASEARSCLEAIAKEKL